MGKGTHSASRRNWVGISNTCVKSCPWLCTPVTPALVGRKRQIWSVWWLDIQTKSERPCLKTRRQKVIEEDTQAPLPVPTYVPTYMYVLHTYTHRHMYVHTVTATTKQKTLLWPAEPPWLTVHPLLWLSHPLSVCCSSPGTAWTFFLPQVFALAAPSPFLGIETGLSPLLPSGVFSNVTCSERFPEYHIGNNAPLFHSSPWFISLLRAYLYMMFYSPVKLYRTTSPLW